MPSAALLQDSGTELGDLISERMAEVNLSIRGLAEKVGLTYEHTRRIVRGDAPSDVILKAICNELSLDFDAAKRLAVAARIRKKYKTIPIEISGKNPELESIERAWKYLTEDQKQSAISMIQSWAKLNKATL